MNKKRELLFNFIRGLTAILIALFVATIFIFISVEATGVGDRFVQTGKALRYMLISPLFTDSGFSVRSFTQILAAMIPIMFTGLAVCVMFSANQFNLAGEGSVLLGGFTAALCAIYITGLPPVLHVIVCLLAASLVCGLVMLIPALLKVKLGASEMVSSLMLNYVILYVVMYLLNSFFADRSKGQTQTFSFPATAKLHQLVDNGSMLSSGFVIAIICVVLIGLFLYRTRWGYSIRMIGFNQAFSRYSGMKVGGVVVLSQVVGGLLSGLGGGIEIIGRYNSFSWKTLPGYGWTGITVAILAKNNPLFVPLAAFFMAYLDKGCSLMSTYTSVPSQMIDIIQAVIFLFFAAEQFLSRYRQKMVVKGAKEELRAQAAAAKAEGGVANV